MKRAAVIVAMLVSLVLAGMSQKAKTVSAHIPTPAVQGHCGEPYTVQLACIYETDEVSGLKHIVECLCYNFATGETWTE